MTCPLPLRPGKVLRDLTFWLLAILIWLIECVTHGIGSMPSRQLIQSFFPDKWQSLQKDGQSGYRSEVLQSNTNVGEMLQFHQDEQIGSTWLFTADTLITPSSMCTLKREWMVGSIYVVYESNAWQLGPASELPEDIPYHIWMMIQLLFAILGLRLYIEATGSPYLLLRPNAGMMPATVVMRLHCLF